MPKFILPVIVVALVGLALSIAGLVTVLRRQPTTPSAPPPPGPGMIAAPTAESMGLSIPPFGLTNQAGESVTEDLFKGRLTIACFIFTHCPLACPGMTLRMSELADALTDTPVRFASISVDPVHDTPERLRAYAAQNNADLTRWTFLTGTQPQIDAIVKSALQFALQPDPKIQIPLDDGSTMANIVHPTKLLLVGPDRRILGFYETNIPGEMDNLAARAREVIKELNITTRP